MKLMIYDLSNRLVMQNPLPSPKSRANNCVVGCVSSMCILCQDFESRIDLGIALRPRQYQKLESTPKTIGELIKDVAGWRRCRGITYMSSWLTMGTLVMNNLTRQVSAVSGYLCQSAHRIRQMSVPLVAHSPSKNG